MVHDVVDDQSLRLLRRRRQRDLELQVVSDPGTLGPDLERGSTRAKTWKGWKLRLAAGELRVLRKSHSLRAVTTRRDYPGVHMVDLVVNGDVVTTSRFELRGTPPRSATVGRA